MGISRKLITITVLFLATVATGFWRGNSGSPTFPGLLHKLLGLAWVIFTAIVVCHAGRPVESRTAFFSAIAVLAVLMVRWSQRAPCLPCRSMRAPLGSMRTA